MNSRVVGRFAFGGRRFVGHALPFESVTELAAFQELVREIGRWLYRLDHPDVRRAPSGFDDLLSLCFRRIEEGSVVLPLERMVADPASMGFITGEGYLERAIQAIVEAASAVDLGNPLPHSFPRSALDHLERFGATLREDEWFIIQSLDGRSCRYTIHTRQRLLSLATASYQDSVDIVARVIEADVRRSTFTLSIPKRPPITAVFAPEQEATVLEALRNHVSQQVRVRGRGTFSSSGILQKVDPVEFIQPLSDVSRHADRPVWELILEMMSDIPDEEAKKLPSDLAQNVDHYLYGTLKHP